MRNLYKIPVIILFAVALFVGATMVVKADIGLGSVFQYNYVRNLLYRIPVLSQTLFGGTSTSTSAVVEIQGSNPLGLPDLADGCLEVAAGTINSTGVLCGSGGGGGSAAGSAGAVQYSDGAGGFLASSTDFFYDTAVGQVHIGGGTSTVDGTDFNPLIVARKLDSYVAVTVQNQSSHPEASSDFVVANDIDNGDADTGTFGNLGIGSSNYNIGGDVIAGPSDIYLTATGGDLALYTRSAGNIIKFATGGFGSIDNLRVTMEDDRTTFFANYEPDIAKDVASSTLWTGNNGWSVSSGLVKVTGSATGIIYPTASTTIVSGTKYKVTVTATSTTGVPTYSLGGVTGSNITNGTFTDYIEALTTGDIIFSGASTTATTITALEILPLRDDTGDVFVEGDLKVGGSITNNNDDTIFNISGEGVVTFPNIPFLPVDYPTEDNQAANKGYVDNVARNQLFVANVRAGTTAALPTVTYSNGASGVGATLTATANGALPAQDGVTLIAGDMLLVKNQANAAHNGSYLVTQVGSGGTPFILTRITRYDNQAEITVGTYFTILEGTTQILQQWIMDNNATITVGTTNITFSKLSGQVVYTAGNNAISISGTVISLVLSVTNPALEIVADGLRVLVDNSTIERTSLGIAVKDAGITAAKLATGAVDLSTATVTGTLGATKGGTGQSTITTGDLLYGSAANTWSKLPGVATGNSLISGGVGVAPSWGKIGLTTHISGTLARANGGTGLTTSADDTTLIGNGTIYQAKTLADCDSSSNALTYDITTNNFGCNTITGGGGGSGASNAVNLQYTKTLDVSSSTVAVANTVAATTVYSYSVPANTLGTDKGLRLNLSGTYLNNSGASRNVTITATYGGTTLISQATPAIVTSGTTGNWGVNLYLMAANATNAQRSRLEGSFEAGTAVDVVINDNGSSAVDSTINQTLTITVTNSAAAATIITTKNLAVLEQLNAQTSVGGSNWIFGNTYNTSVLTPSTTIGTWFKAPIYASSTATFGSSTQLIIGTSTLGADLFPSLSGTSRDGVKSVMVETGSGVIFKETASSNSNPLFSLFSADNTQSASFELATTTGNLFVNANNTILAQGTSAKIGIGSTTPTYKLSVNGDVGFVGDGFFATTTIGSTNNYFKFENDVNLGGGFIIPTLSGYLSSSPVGSTALATKHAFAIVEDASLGSDGEPVLAFLAKDYGTTGNIGVIGYVTSTRSMVISASSTIISSDSTLVSTGSFSVGSSTPYAKVAVTPDPIYGEEEVTNPGFTGSATGWTMGTGWVYVTDDVEHQSGNTADLSQAGTLDPAKTYKVQVVQSGSVGSINVCLDAGTCQTINFGDPGFLSFTGSWVNGTGVKIKITPSSNYDGSVDFVSIEEVLTKAPDFIIDNEESYSFKIDNYDLYSVYPNLFQIPLLTGTSKGSFFPDSQVLGMKGALVILPPDQSSVLFGSSPMISFFDPATLGGGSISYSTTTQEFTIDQDGATTTITSAYLNLTGGGCYAVNGVCLDAGIWTQSGSNFATYVGDGSGATVGVLNDTFPAFLLGNSAGNVFSGIVFNTAADSLAFTQASGGYSFDNNLDINGDLDVNGNVDIDFGTLFVDANTGRVGISTTTPSDALEVNGNINIASSSTYKIGYSSVLGFNASLNNLFLGGAGNPTGTGSRNIYSGLFAGFGNNGAGSDNINTGYLSNGYAQDASRNSTYGSESFGGGVALVTGVTDNVAMGYRSGYGFSTGAIRNVLIGALAGDNLVGGDANIIIGNSVALPVQGGSQQLNIGNLIYGTSLYNGSATSSTAVAGSVGIATSTPWKTFSVVGDSVIAGLLKIKAGLSSMFANVGGTIVTESTDAGNSTTVETDLYSSVIATSTLATNQDYLEGRYTGTFVSSGTATRQVKIYFAGTQCFDTGALSVSASAVWRAEVTVIRVSNTVVRCSVALNTSGASLGSYTGYTEISSLNLTSNNYILKITGQAGGVGAATNDIVAKMSTIKWYPGDY